MALFTLLSISILFFVATQFRIPACKVLNISVTAFI